MPATMLTKGVSKAKPIAISRPVVAVDESSTVRVVSVFAAVTNGLKQNDCRGSSLVSRLTLLSV